MAATDKIARQKTALRIAAASGSLFRMAAAQKNSLAGEAEATTEIAGELT
ncbi:hypothetical protein ACFSFZ_13670 [Mixta tenebrionis]|nr:hypothetical protein [Mixta tenebrionis]